MSLVLGIFISLNIAYAVPAAALLEGSKQAVCKGLALSDSGTCADSATATSATENIVKTALNIFSVVIGIIAVVMIMIGGVKYVTSQGDSNQTNSAKNTILYAAIGLVIAALSQVVVRFVLARFG